MGLIQKTAAIVLTAIMVLTITTTLVVGTTALVMEQSSNNIEFTAKIASFNETNRNGTRIMPGAFSQVGIVNIPVFLDHIHERKAQIGALLFIEVRADGIYARGKLNLDKLPAIERQLVLEGLMNSVSVGYIIKKSYTDAAGATVVQQMDLIETSLVGIPADPKARILSIKK